jgi:hypothetical protein
MLVALALVVVFTSGGSSDSDGVSTTKTVYTVGAWVGSMLGGAVISFALYHTLAALPGLG